MKCEWVLQNPDENLVNSISEKHDVSGLLARILVNNGITDDGDIKRYLEPENEDFFDPYLMKDMDKIVETLLQIRDKKESLVIYGDYDVDGVTSTAMVYSILKQFGWDVSFYIPSRLEEGYGLSKTAIMDLFNRGIRNIMTVDCGITSFGEVDYANFLKFKILITDHHDVQNILPKAVAVVNPKRPDDTYPDKYLAGVGVAFKVMHALLMKLGHPEVITEYLDLVTLGTVADIVPLRGENRIIVKKGLKFLAETKRIGLKKLMELSGLNLDQIKTYDIGFKIAPKLNAVGRLESAYAALNLLLSEDEHQGAEIAKYLNSQNVKRQEIENQIYREAEAIIASNEEFSALPLLVLAKDDWHPGVIGIVSSRLTSKYYKPTLMISLDSEGVGRGSARSIEQVNIMELFGKVHGMFLEYGGHPMAAGFSIDSSLVDDLRKALSDAYISLYNNDSFTSKIRVDSVLRIEEIDDDFLEDIDILRPFGQANHEPAFMIENAAIERFKLMGNKAQHIRMILKQGDQTLDTIGFNLSDSFEDFRYIRPNLLKCDVVGNIKSMWHYGVKHTQMFLKDIRLCIDPSFKDEEEEDKTFVFELIKNWEKQRVSHKIQNLNVLKADYAHKLKSKFKAFSRFIDEEQIAVFANIKAQEILMTLKIIKNFESKKNMLVVSPSNVFLSHRFNIIKRFDILETVFMDSMGENPDSLKCVFATLPMVLANENFFKENFDDILMLDFEYLLLDKMLSVGYFNLFSNFLKEYGGTYSVLGTKADDAQKEAFIKNYNLNSILIEHLGKHSRGLVDRRNIKNPIEYIRQLVKNGEFVAVLTNSTAKTVEVTKLAGKVLSEYFQNGEVVFYNNNLKPVQRTRIEELVSTGKVRLLITTPHMGGLVEFPNDANICLMDAPLTPLEVFSITSPTERKKCNSIFHLLYNKDDVEKSQNDFSGYFPSEEQLVEILKLICSNGVVDISHVKRELEEKNIINRNFWGIYDKIFQEIGMLDHEKIINKNIDELIPRVKELPRVIEGEMDRRIIDLYSDYFIKKSARNILDIIDYPPRPLY